MSIDLRSVRFRVVTLMVAALLGGVAVSGGAGAAEPQDLHSETASYTAAPLGGVDCATNAGGACFELAGDERTIGIVVNDDQGWVGIPVRYTFAGAGGTALGAGELCDQGWVPVPKGATALTVEVAAVAAQTACNQASVSWSGRIFVTYSLKNSVKHAELDGERNCIGGFVPEPLSMRLQGTDTGQRIPLDVLVLHDAVDPGVAQESIDRVVQAYAQIGIDVRYEVREVDLATPPLANGLYARNALFAEIRGLFGGSVPKGFDLVHTMTSKDIDGAAGFAFCVGGIRSREHAFSMGEESPGKVPNLIAGVPVPVWPWEGAGYIATHEIGHLLGGNHDYANCAEGWLDPSGAPPGACTIMHPNLNISFQFSTLNRTEIREYGIRWAAP